MAHISQGGLQNFCGRRLEQSLAFHCLCAMRVIAIRYLFDNEDDNCHSSIIMDISKTNFINLKIIDLSNFMIKTVKNNIESIEQLQFMNMPLLEELHLGKTSNNLGENNITKVSALNKCAWNSLKCLDLGRC